MKKKILSAVLGAVIAACSLAGCGVTNSNLKEPEKGLIQISAFDGGYGLEWLQMAADEFMRLNSGKTVTIRTLNTNTDCTQAHTNVRSGIYVGDILYDTVSVNTDAALGLYKDLGEVYDLKPDGEAGKTVKEKLSDDVLWAMKKIAENKRVTELYALCGRVAATGNVPFIYTLDTEGYYPQYIINEFYYQLCGYENVRNASIGMVNGERDMTGETLFELEGRKEAVEDAARFFDGRGQMTDGATVNGGLSFIQAQGYFWGVNVGQGTTGAGKTKLAAFMINGDWNYSETRASYGDTKNADIRFMETPVSSKFVDLLDTLDDDEELSALVKAIDENASAILGSAETVSTNTIIGDGYEVSKSDFMRVYEARRICVTTLNQQLLSVPANCGDFELVKEFLKFMASDTVQYYKAVCLNGVSTPFNRNEFEGVTRNDFIKSKEDIVAKDAIVMTMLSQSPIATFYSLAPKMVDAPSRLYNGTFADYAVSDAYKGTVTGAYRQALEDNRNVLDLLK